MFTSEKSEMQRFPVNGGIGTRIHCFRSWRIVRG